MKKSFLILCVVVALLALGTPFNKANAFANVSSYSLGCSSFLASGTSDQPYVTIYAYVNGDDYFTIVATSGGSYSGVVNFPEQPNGAIIENIEVWGSPNTYTNLGDAGYWDLDSYFDADNVACTGAFAGRGIPDGFVLRTITCDVAVYDSAGGSPVTPAATLTAGQTWYVNPTAVTAAGKSWTEVFVSGTTNGFILTNCVQ